MIGVYALSFFVTLFLALLLTKATINFSSSFHLFSKKRPRNIHKMNVSRFGGVALFVSFWTIVFLHPRLIPSPQLAGFFIASAILCIGSLCDDFYEQAWKFQLAIQGIALVPLILSGLRIDFIRDPFGGIIFLSPIIGIIALGVWVIFIVNAINWLDGVDGLASMVGLIALLVLFFLALKSDVNQPPLALTNIIMAGSLAGFVLYNFPPAKIFLGTVGANFLGFFLATQAVFAGGKLATTTLVLTPFLFDVIWVIYTRIKENRSPFIADYTHLHFRLLKKGLSPKIILLFYVSMSGALGIIALMANTKEKFILLAIATLLSLLISLA